MKKVFLLAVISVFTTFAHAQSAEERELNRLSNIINNNVPVEYREPLNRGVAQLRDILSARGYGGQYYHRSVCQLVSGPNGFWINKGESPISQYVRDSAITAANDHKTLSDAGLCGRKGELADLCSVERGTNGMFFVQRESDKKPVSQYFRDSAITAADDLKALAQAGVCFPR